MTRMFVRIFKSWHDRSTAPESSDVTNTRFHLLSSEGARHVPADGYDHGLLGVIERMFSGLLIDHAIAVAETPAVAEKAVVAIGGAPPGDRIGPNDIDVLATIAGPQIYPLPNSPTGWGQSTRGEKVAIGVRMDPARPDGLIEDAQGLGTDAYGEMMAAESAKTNSEREAGK